MYKSKKILYVLNLFLSFTFINLNAKSIEVCSSCKITSIIKAIDYAKDHDTILIKKGTYKEFNIIVDKACQTPSS